ncbi:MAG: hypothetical protein NWQ53_04110 [Flavobacteriales bacterium]|nr:hypothetical protein [Flavobacteriales bacterium]MDP4952806.1 hypothetical protein [Flavobacteriales bacterium]
MDKNSAALILDLHLPFSEDDVLDRVEEKVFELRDFFLMQSIHPVLFSGRRNRLESILKAKNALLQQAIAPLALQYENVLDSTAFLPLLETYSSALMQLRLKVSSSLSPEVLIPVVDAMIQLQIAFEQYFLDLGKDLPEVAPPKQTEAINLGKVIYQLKHGEDVAFDLAREKARVMLRTKL